MFFLNTYFNNKKIYKKIINYFIDFNRIEFLTRHDEILFIYNLSTIFKIENKRIKNKISERKKIYGDSFLQSYSNYLLISETKSRYNSNKYKVKFICEVLMSVKETRIFNICHKIYENSSKKELNNLLFALEDSVIDYFAYKQISENYDWYLKI